MTPEELFFNYGRPLGIGGIAMAGIIGIIKSSKIIRQALGLAVKELKGKKNVETRERTERDLPMKTILSVLIAVLVAVLFFFQFGVLHNWLFTGHFAAAWSLSIGVPRLRRWRPMPSPSWGPTRCRA